MTDEMEIDADDSAAIAAPTVRGGLDPDAARLFRVYRTISNMLLSRGYMVPKEMREMSPASFKARFGEQPSRESLTILVEKADDETNQLFVFFRGGREGWGSTYQGIH
mmetsp:Transcript_4786/g.10710  ORF Transcript_4786/g.10710 Transcript_4786/m.10710 type:complete len:108 (-) Transcript_4786:199-522(-)